MAVTPANEKSLFFTVATRCLHTMQVIHAAYWLLPRSQLGSVHSTFVPARLASTRGGAGVVDETAAVLGGGGSDSTGEK